MKVKKQNKVVMKLTEDEFLKLLHTLVCVCQWDISHGHRETLNEYIAKMKTLNL